MRCQLRQSCRSLASDPTGAAPTGNTATARAPVPARPVTISLRRFKVSIAIPPLLGCSEKSEKRERCGKVLCGEAVDDERYANAFDLQRDEASDGHSATWRS